MDLSKVTDFTDSNAITRAYIDSLLVEARYMDSVEPDLGMTLYGRRLSSPIMIAAFSHLNSFHEDGMAEMARGAAAAGVCNWAGMGSEDELRRITAACPDTVKIVKPYADRGRVVRMLQLAQECGAMAVGIDIDHSFGGSGHPDVVLGDEMKPLTSQELKQLVRETDLPFVIKGILSVQDAVKCAEAGVRGLLLSHHHGIMKCAVPPMLLLPAVAKAVGREVDLFVDCGIASGEDAFKALALGAKAVCVGRSILPSLKENGAAGVQAYLSHMHDGLRAMMARTCSPDPDHIAGDLLWDASTGRKL